jgi:hypothetical protein
MADEGVYKEYQLLNQREQLASRLTDWMLHVPVFGRLMWHFWHGLIASGVKDVMTPRWGEITFHYLNDGMKPTLWHTWRSIVDPEEGIWVGRAPRNAADAAWLMQHEEN